MENLMILGTSHIAKQSILEIHRAIENFKPDIVAVELDPGRYNALLNKIKTRLQLKEIKNIGPGGFVFAVIARLVQSKLGKIVNVDPGAEMLSAIKIAQKNKLRVALVDQDIRITLKRFSKLITFREVIRILLDILKTFFSPKSQIKKLGITNFDLTRVPSDDVVRKLLAKMKLSYPNIYKVLILERDKLMAHRIKNIIWSEPNKKILLVIGKAHEAGIKKLLKLDSIPIQEFSQNSKISEIQGSISYTLN